VKERLTGAIILVALIVLLVPELLTGPIRSAPRPQSAAPANGEVPLRSYTINLADDARAQSAGAIGSGPAQPAPISDTPASASSEAPPSSPPLTAPHTAPDRSASSAAASKEASRLAPAAAPARKAAAASSAATGASPVVPTANARASSGGTFVVQLGSFASRANAERLAHQVRVGGFAVSVSQGSSGRRLYRVRVGPAHDRAAAAQLAAKLHAAGHDGAIVPQ
jgi:DedD protein